MDKIRLLTEVLNMVNKCWVRIYADVIKHNIKKLEEIEDDELREEVRKYIEEKNNM